jgi:hypothetical protein
MMTDALGTFTFLPIQCDPLDGKSTAEKIQRDFSAKYFRVPDQDKVKNVAWCILVELDHEDKQAVSDQKKVGTLRWLTNQELEEIKKEIGRIKFADSFHEILRILKSAIFTTDNQSKKQLLVDIVQAFESAPMQKRKIDPNDPKTRFRPIIEESERFIEAIKLEDILETLKLTEKPAPLYPKLEKRQEPSSRKGGESTAPLYPKLPKRTKEEPQSSSLYPSVPVLSEKALLQPGDEVRANIARMEREAQEKAAKKNANKASGTEFRFYKKPVPQNRKPAQKRPQFKDPFQNNVAQVEKKAIEKKPTVCQIPKEFDHRTKKPYGKELPHNMSVPLSHKSHLNHSFVGLYLQRACSEESIENFVKFLLKLSPSQVKPYAGYFDKVYHNLNQMEKALYLLEKMQENLEAPIVQVLLKDFAKSVAHEKGVQSFLVTNLHDAQFGKLYAQILEHVSSSKTQ